MAATIRILVESSGGAGALKKDLSDLGDTAKKAGGGFSAMEQIATGALRAVGAGLLDVAVKGGAMLVDFAKSSITAAGDFEAGMKGFQAAANLDPTQLKEFQSLFIQLGKDLPVSTAEVQEAATVLVKAGLDPAVVKAGALKDSLQFAAAAGMELADAAELTTKMLGTFVDMGASTEEQVTFMAGAQDLLTKAANASTLDVDKLGDAMLQAAGAAKGAGVEYQDFVTTMGMISPAFGSAAEAGTSFKNLVARLVPATESAKDMMLALGITTEEGGNKFFDAQGQFLGMRNAAEVLQNAFHGLSDAERTEALSTLFGNDAKGAAMALISAGAEQYDIFAQKMADANGVTAQAAATQQGFNFAMTNLKGSLEALQITLGTALLPYLTAGANMLNTFVGGLIAFADALFASGDPLAFLAAQLGVTGAAGTHLSAVWQTMQMVVQNVMNAYLNIANAILPIIQGFVQKHGAEISAFFQQAWTQITTIIQTALQLYNAIVPPILSWIAAFINAHGAEITAYLEGAWQVISSLIDAALTLIQGVLKAALQIIQGDWSGAWETIKSMSARIVEDIIRVIEGAATMLYNAAKMGVDAIVDAWNSFRGWAGIGGSVVDGIISGIAGKIGSLAAKAAEMARSALSAAKGALGIESPSKEFMQLGRFAGEGFMLGMESMTPAVTMSGAAMAGAGLTGAASTVNNTRNVTLNYSPKITGRASSPQKDYGVMSALVKGVFS